MADSEKHAVTGAFGYSGRYIAKRLLDKGHQVMTLTHSPHRRGEDGSAIEIHPFHFDQPDQLVESLRGVRGLYNTYWVRFNHKTFSHAEAVRNTRILFDSALRAGVERIVHVSITNPSLDSPLEYFSGKAVLEDALRAAGAPHTILRPAVIFGREDILVNNIAWMLRHLPVFGVFGDGRYRLQPIHVEDLADLAVAEGEGSGNRVVNAIGPETFTYRELVETIGAIIGHRRPIVSVPPSLGYWTARLLGALVDDVILTREEIAGLMADLLYVDTPPAGPTRLTDWAREQAGTLGLHYTSELARRRDREHPYASN